ncbi:MAG TPA: NosD domain-containing protein [bacterium]|nr:NosD domain-containing protein [bacterium]HPJ71214.1 NosD domain-containing protein [bacterium]HPQ66746.1 NosD domain-containing protein [bacterium]
MKRAAWCVFFSVGMLIPFPALAQNWYLSTDLGGQVNAVGAVDPGDVWAVLGSPSDPGEIFHYDGSAWSLQTTITSPLTAVEALDAAHVWAGGEDGTTPVVYFYNGSGWSFQTEVVNGVWLNDFYAADALAVWFTSSRIYVTWSGGAAWEIDTEATYHQYGIDGLNQGTHIWTVGGPYGSLNQVLYCQTGFWFVQTEVANWNSQTIQLRAVCAVTDGEAWAAGAPGHILRYNGSDWSVSTRVEYEDFLSLAARGPGDVWAGTKTGKIYRFDGSEWGFATDLGSGWIYGLAAAGDEVWAADNNGLVFRFGASTPTPVGYHTPTPTAPPTCTPPPTLTPPLTPSPSPTPGLPPTPPPDCGCVGTTQTFRWGDTITEDCTMNSDLEWEGSCFTVGTDGITIDGAGHSITEYNGAYTGTATGIDLNGRSNVTIRNLGIYQFSYGMHVEDCANIAILDNVISENKWWYGIIFSDTSDSTIAGNTLEGNGLNTGGAAMWLGGASFNHITGNTINRNDVGLDLDFASDSNIISGNTVTDNKNDGLRIISGSHNSIDSNEFCSNAWSPVTTQGYCDIRVIIGTDNTGINNFCGTASGYHDTGAVRCNFACSPGWINDYDGDGTSDIGIFRDASGLWAIRSVTRVYFGGSGDRPEPGDYDGDGTTDFAVFRDSSGLWAVRGLTRAYFGGGYDLPLPGDYDGDGTSDIGIFRASSGLWAVRAVTRVYFGGTGDLPVPGYYDGSGKVTAAVFRASSGLWALRGTTRIYFGNSADQAVPGDYAGAGAWKPGIFRSSSGLWALREVSRVYFGSGSDRPVPAVYQGNRKDDVGIFRSSLGLWAVREVTRVYFGQTGDEPVAR